GVKVGDQIVRANGHLIRSYVDWELVLFNLKVDEPTILEIHREASVLTLSVIPERRGFRHGSRAFLYVVLRTGELVMLGLACFLAFARPRNPVALVAALLFAGLSNGNAPELVTGLYTMLRELPPVVFPVLALSWLLAGLSPVLFFTFCARFPRPLFRG